MCDCKERGLATKIYKSKTWLCDHNRLSKVFPQIIALWSSSNKSTADELLCNTNYKALLICSKCKHTNEKVISGITIARQFICSECRHKHNFKTKPNCDCEEQRMGTKTKDIWVCSHNNLLTACPNINEFWKESNRYKAEHIWGDSHVRCQLICQNGHEKEEKALSLKKTGKYECQQCNLLYNNAAVKYPHLVAEVNDETDLSQYLWASTKIVNWKCSINNCGYVWNASVQTRTLYGHGCAKCAGNIAYTYETFVIKANDIHKNKYTYSPPSGKFDMYIKLSITCPVESHGVFLQKARHHIQPRGCPKCGQSSRGEAIINEYLTTKNIKFTSQERFTSLKIHDDRYSKYDFYLLEFNLVIEFDGLQHFQTTNWNNDNDKNSVLARMKKDIVKEQFLLDNGISIVRIPYIAIEHIPGYLDWLLPKLDPKRHDIITYKHYINQLINTREIIIAYTESATPSIDWANVC